MKKTIETLKKRADGIGIAAAVDDYFKRVMAECEDAGESEVVKDALLSEACEHLEEELEFHESTCRAMKKDTVPNPEALKFTTPAEARGDHTVIID